MSTHGWKGIGRLIHGSFAETVVRFSPVPVLTHRNKSGESAFEAPRTILVPTDFSENSWAVLPTVRFLGRHYGARFTFLHVAHELGDMVPVSGPVKKIRQFSGPSG